MSISKVIYPLYLEYGKSLSETHNCMAVVYVNKKKESWNSIQVDHNYLTLIENSRLRGCCSCEYNKKFLLVIIPFSQMLHRLHLHCHSGKSRIAGEMK